jgi:hypothetical protein
MLWTEVPILQPTRICSMKPTSDHVLFIIDVKSPYRVVRLPRNESTSPSCLRSCNDQKPQAGEVTIANKRTTGPLA